MFHSTGVVVTGETNYIINSIVNRSPVNKINKRNGGFFMKKFFIFTLVVFVILAINFTGYTAQEGVLEMVASILYTPENIITKAFYQLTNRISELSKGQINITVYDSASLYNQAAEFDAIANGLIDLSIVGFQDRPNLRYPAMFKSAYMFSGRDHALRFYDGEVGQRVFEDHASILGVRPLGTFDVGTRNILLTKEEEVRTPQDMNGVKLRMPGSPDWIALGEALGGTPTPVPYNDVYMALKTGIVDAAENRLATLQRMKWIEVAKQIVMTGHIPWTLHPAINEARWQDLTDEQRGWIQQAVDEAVEWERTNIEAEDDEMIDLFKSMGIKITYPDINAFREYASNYYKTNTAVTEHWDWDIYNYALSSK